jgi:glycosyltransferase involved in cell wall biosynthesis
MNDHNGGTLLQAEDADSSETAVVVIGRNEGSRLRTCLESVRNSGNAVIYVDSGSSDGSVELATGLGASVVALDTRRPFSAARARNEGVQRLMSIAPAIKWIQFVDGDCQLVEGWIASARRFLEANPNIAAVCGRLRERFPERSVYNLLCDIEWNTPVGEARACGGIAMLRVEAFRQVEGFRDGLVAGEEPELCVRLRARGWRIWRLDAEMALHDAAMTRFDQWWRRNVRAGFAFAEGVRLHGAPPERHWVKEWRSAWFWGAGLPFAIGLSAAIAGPVAIWAAAIYPLQILRLGWRFRGLERGRWAHAFFLVAGKFPAALGQAKSWLLHRRRQQAVLIEYK